MNKYKVLSLYRTLIRESKKFPAYNFRQYALRKVRDEFRQNKDLKRTQEVEDKFKEGIENLEVIKRQVTIGQLYTTEKLVIENKK